MKTVLLPTACWPNLQYFYHLFHASDVVIEKQDHYRKQSFRTRYLILSANGVLPLSIPVVHTGSRQCSGEVAITYNEKWQERQWTALTSAYRSSPYFEYFEDEIRPFYSEKTELLLEYNLRQLETIFKLLRKKLSYTLTDEYFASPKEMQDLRTLVEPERELTTDTEAAAVLNVPYYQTFGYKFPFAPNLSMLDLLFNKGLGAIDYFALST